MERSRLAEDAAVFKGPTQNARVLSEGWVAAHAFCPSSGATPLTVLRDRGWLAFNGRGTYRRTT